MEDTWPASSHLSEKFILENLLLPMTVEKTMTGTGSLSHIFFVKSYHIFSLFPVVWLSQQKSNFRKVFHQVSRLIGNCLQLTAFIPPGYSVFIGTQLINISRLPSKRRSRWFSTSVLFWNCQFCFLAIFDISPIRHSDGYNFGLTAAWTAGRDTEAWDITLLTSTRSSDPDCGTLNKQLSLGIARDCPSPCLPRSTGCICWREERIIVLQPLLLPNNFEVYNCISSDLKTNMKTTSI